MQNNPTLRDDEESGLRELLAVALAAPARGLSKTQTGQIVGRAARTGPAAWTLLVAAACLALAISAGLSGVWAGTAQRLALALAAANLGLSPLAAMALIWRRRSGNAI